MLASRNWRCDSMHRGQLALARPSKLCLLTQLNLTRERTSNLADKECAGEIKLDAEHTRSALLNICIMIFISFYSFSFLDSFAGSVSCTLFCYLLKSTCLFSLFSSILFLSKRAIIVSSYKLVCMSRLWCRFIQFAIKTHNDFLKRRSTTQDIHKIDPILKWASSIFIGFFVHVHLRDETGTSQCHFCSTRRANKEQRRTSEWVDRQSKSNEKCMKGFTLTDKLQTVEHSNCMSYHWRCSWYNIQQKRTTKGKINHTIASRDYIAPSQTFFKRFIICDLRYRTWTKY